MRGEPVEGTRGFAKEGDHCAWCVQSVELKTYLGPVQPDDLDAVGLLLSSQVLPNTCTSRSRVESGECVGEARSLARRKESEGRRDCEAAVGCRSSEAGSGMGRGWKAGEGAVSPCSDSVAKRRRGVIVATAAPRAALSSTIADPRTKGAPLQSSFATANAIVLSSSIQKSARQANRTTCEAKVARQSMKSVLTQAAFSTPCNFPPVQSKFR